MKLRRIASSVLVALLLVSMFGVMLVFAPPPSTIPPSPVVNNVFVTNTSDDPVPVDITDESIGVTFDEPVEVAGTVGIDDSEPVDVTFDEPVDVAFDEPVEVAGTVGIDDSEPIDVEITNPEDIQVEVSPGLTYATGSVTLDHDAGTWNIPIDTAGYRLLSFYVTWDPSVQSEDGEIVVWRYLDDWPVDYVGLFHLRLTVRWSELITVEVTTEMVVVQMRTFLQEDILRAGITLDYYLTT